MDDCDHYLHVQARAQRVIAANTGRLSAEALQRLGAPTPVSKPRPAVVVRPIFEKGRYIPKSLANIIEIVAKAARLTPAILCGLGKRRHMVDARSCVAVLAEQFAGHQSECAVDDAMLRGHGMTRWYRQRHTDRLALYPQYAALYQRCHAEMVK